MAWAYVTAGRSDALLFPALASAAERLTGVFSAQGLNTLAWAFANLGELAPSLLDPVAVLDSTESQGAMPQVILYQMAVQGLSTISEEGALPNEPLQVMVGCSPGLPGPC